MPQNTVLSDLLALTEAALPEVAVLVEQATEALRAATSNEGRISGALLEANQYQAHGLSWLATYNQSLIQLRGWAGRLAEDGKLGTMEQLIVQIGFGEYLAQIQGGIQMNQGEMVRLADLGVSWTPSEAAAKLIAEGNSNAARMALVAMMRDVQGRSVFGTSGLDEDLEMIR
ncbi:MAG: acyl-CoA dehydrogenase, partial [Paracoccaceae bacterium]